MSCPHGLYSTPARCSQCQGAAPRRVGHDERGVTIDGEPIGRGLDQQRPALIPRRRRRARSPG